MEIGVIDEIRCLLIQKCMQPDHSRLDWNHLRAFLATVETGSLSAAARRLGLTQPTLGRQITALEAALSLMLFERNGRQLSLTDAGRELIEGVRGMGAAADRLALVASGQRSALSGTVRITASDATAACLLPEVIRQTRLAAPRIRIEIVATDDIRDLMKREADIAVRHVRPEQPNLMARLLREKTGHLYAASAYLDARGRPRQLSDLARHDWISMGDTERMREYLAGTGIDLPAEAFVVNSENSLVAWQMACAGLGIAPMDDDIAALSPQMERVLPEAFEVPFPVWLVTHREIHTSPRIRLVFDILARVLGADGPAARLPS